MLKKQLNKKEGFRDTTPNPSFFKLKASNNIIQICSYIANLYKNIYIIICMAKELFPLDRNNNLIPIELL